MIITDLPASLEHECATLATLGGYAEALALLERESAYALNANVRYLRAFCAARLGRLIDALRWIQADPGITVSLRRLEIQVLCALRRHREVIDRIHQTFEAFPHHAADFAFFAINELVFHRAFFEARYVIEHASTLIARYQPGTLHDFRERQKFVDSTERLLDLVLADPRYDLIQVERRLGGIDVPRVAWNDVAAGRFGSGPAQITNCFAGLAVRTRPPGRALFFADATQSAVTIPDLPPAKPAFGFVLTEMRLTDIQRTINLSFRHGLIFPQLSSRSATVNAGFCVSERAIEPITVKAGFLLPPLGDVGYFNGILNGLFGMLVWKRFFADLILIVPPGYSPALKDYASMLAIDPGAIIWDAQCTQYMFEVGVTFLNEGRSLDAPTLSVFQGLLDQLDTTVHTVTAGSDRLYISRRQAKQRRLKTEAELEARLRIMGFDILCLEEMTPAEQIAACRRARVIVAPHGAGLTNLVFAPDIELVIELIPIPIMSAASKIWRFSWARGMLPYWDERAMGEPIWPACHGRSTRTSWRGLWGTVWGAGERKAVRPRSSECRGGNGKSWLG